jgi:hypothetical protein
MKISTYCLVVMAAFFTLNSKAQMEPGIRLKGEYIPFSNYNPNGNGDSNSGKSDMRRIEGGIGIPLSATQQRTSVLIPLFLSKIPFQPHCAIRCWLKIRYFFAGFIFKKV